MANAEEIGSNFANFAESHRHPLDNDIDVHNDIDVVAITRASVPPFVSFFRNGGGWDGDERVSNGVRSESRWTNDECVYPEDLDARIFDGY